MKSIRHIALSGASIAVLVLSASPSLAASSAEWTTVGGDKGNTKYSTLNQITAANVANLREVWRAPNSGGHEVTPLVINNVMYSASGTQVVALDPVTGRDIWRVNLNRLVVDNGQFHGPARPQGIPGGPRAADAPAPAAGQPVYIPLGVNTKYGVAYWPGAGTAGPRIVLATRSGFLIQFDAKTGELIKSVGKDGLIDLRVGVMEKFGAVDYTPGMVPAIYKNLAVVMPRSGDQGRYGAPGDARAFDLQTGKEVWTFHTVPRPGEPNFGTWGMDGWQDRRGPGGWVHMAIDAPNNLLVFGTTNTNDQNYGAWRPGDNLYASSIVAVNGDTGELKWWFQHTQHDIYDWATSSNPVMADVKDRNGNIVPALIQTTKSGFLFMLNRLTGEHIFEVERKPIPPSDAPGETTSPDQPVPKLPSLTIARQGLSRDEVANLNPQSHAYCLAQYDKLNQMGRGTPYGMSPSLVFPSSTGGSTVSGPSYDPNTNYIFTNVKQLGTVAMLTPFLSSNIFDSLAKSKLPFEDEEGYPCSEPPWGELMAINAATGELVWKKPLGEIPELTAKGIPPTGTDNVGGGTVTAGGVLFIGASQDKTFRAFDVRNGNILWKVTLNGNASATPLTYLTPSGKQYVTVSTTAPNSELVTFALP